MTVKRLQGVCLAAIACSVALPAAAQDAPDLHDVGRLAGVIRWSGVAFSIVVIVAAALALRFVSSAADRLGMRFANRRPLIQKIESFTRFFIYFATAGLVGALSLRVDTTVLAVVGGALAFAIGFAMRDLVAAVIAGVIIMFDRPFQVGDRVQYAGEYGDIIQVGLRSVRMRTLSDNIVTIPNNKVLTDVTSSGNYGALDMMVVMEFYIGMSEDAELAERLVKESLLTSRYVFLEKPIVTIVRQEAKEYYLALRITGKAYVLDVQYELAFVSDVHKRVLRAFRKHGIEPPTMLRAVEARAATA